MHVRVYVCFASELPKVALSGALVNSPLWPNLLLQDHEALAPFSSDKNGRRGGGCNAIIIFEIQGLDRSNFKAWTQ
jgi:hypothetical protein